MCDILSGIYGVQEMAECGDVSTSKPEFACILWHAQSLDNSTTWPRRHTVVVMHCLPTFSASLYDDQRSC